MSFESFLFICKSLQFIFQKNGTIIYEATIRDRSQLVNQNGSRSDDLLVRWTAIVKKTANGAQSFSVFHLPDKCAFPVTNKEPAVPVDAKIHRNYYRYNKNSIAVRLKLLNFLIELYCNMHMP